MDRDTELARLRALDEATERCFCSHCRQLRVKAFQTAEAPARDSAAETRIKVH